MKSRTTRLILISLTAIVLVAALWLGTRGRHMFLIATGAASHELCDAAFVSHVEPDHVFHEEIAPLMSGIAWAIRYRVDRARHDVHASVLGAFDSRTVFRPGLGCMQIHDNGPVPAATGFTQNPIPSPYPDHMVKSDNPAIRAAIARAFAEPDPTHPRLAKAIVVLHDGQLIAERYALGYGPNTPIWAHSVTKSVISALIGILVRKGKLTPDQPAPIAAWRQPGSPHRAVTINQLLRMDTGLPFDETDDVLSPMMRMQFLQRDQASYAASMPLAHPPGTVWGYSNLSYALLGHMVTAAAGGNAIAAERFARRELFAPLGMTHTLIETDATGTLIGYGGMYSTARDLARFGQLYLDDGVVDGKRILPEGWVDYTRSQTLDTGYGAGFWLNIKHDTRVPVWHALWGMPQVPKDMYYARGAFGQYVVIVPSEKLVVVRMGISLYYGDHTGDLVAAIIAALHHRPQA